MAMQINSANRAKRGQFMDFRMNGGKHSTNSKVRPGHSVPNIQPPQNKTEPAVVQIQISDPEMELISRLKSQQRTQKEQARQEQQTHEQVQSREQTRRRLQVHEQERTQSQPLHKREDIPESEIHQEHLGRPTRSEFRQHLLRSQRRTQAGVTSTNEILQEQQAQPMRRIPARQVFNVSPPSEKPRVAEKAEPEPEAKDDIDDIEFGLIEDLDMHARHPRPKLREQKVESSKIADGGILGKIDTSEKDKADSKRDDGAKGGRRFGKHRLKSPFLKSVHIEKRPLSNVASVATEVAVGSLGGAGLTGNVIAKANTGANMSVAGMNATREMGNVATSNVMGAVNTSNTSGARVGGAGSSGGIIMHNDAKTLRTQELIHAELEKIENNAKNETPEVDAGKNSPKLKDDKKSGSRKVGPTVIVSQKHKLRSNIGLGIAITLTVLVGGVVGAFIYLAFFQ